MLYYQLIVAGFLVVSAEGRNDDVFNYGDSNTVEVGPDNNGVRSFGQSNWQDVTCSDINSCVS